MIKGKKILLGVSSSIALYKAVELVRLFKKAGAEVRVIMTENATKIICPLQFEALSENPVFTDIFSSKKEWNVEHISAADWGDALIMAPSTANIIAKMANGIADDAPTTLYLAFEGPVFTAPAMHHQMWNHPATEKNIRVLENRGVRIIGPDSGRLASGDIGKGRLASPAEIFSTVESHFSKAKILKGLRILITAGPTREMIDPIRFLSNRSSGKMGYALADSAGKLGAEVILVSGPVSIASPPGVKTIKVISAIEMRDSVEKESESTDIFIFAAAVSDYRPEKISGSKIKKGSEKITLQLVSNPDIAYETGLKRKPGQFLAGFAAETENLEISAGKKLQSKNLDLIIANDVSAPETGMESDENAVTIITHVGIIDNTKIMSKIKLAERIIEIIYKEYKNKKEK
jgi:phosphopantothenoylcysteine decarboxylase / phosphopantothenate---cysteine ligase